MRTFAIYNRKGGVGKTTTAVNLAYILATAFQRSVLLVDADSQGDASTIAAKGESSDGLGAVLEGLGDCWGEFICETAYAGLDVLPAGEDMGELDLACMTGRMEPNFHALAGFLEAVAEDEAYDVCIIDCPPYFSLSCLNALAAADKVIIPTDISAYSVVGMTDLVEQIDMIRRAVPVTVAGALVTNYAKSELSEEALGVLPKYSPVPIYETIIRRSPKVNESTWAREPVCIYSPTSATARDMRYWAEELMRKEGMDHA